MSEDSCLVQWTGRQVVVTFPEHLGMPNADRVREQLVWVINRGADVLIADLTGTVSCDNAGADAVARAQWHAIAHGTQLRLVVIADVVRRVLSLGGLDPRVPVYPTVEAAVAAGAERPQVPGEPGTTAITPAGPGLVAASGSADRAADLLDWVVTSIFNVGMTLQAAAGLPAEITEKRIIDALHYLDDVVQEIRHHTFAQHDPQTQPGLPSGRPQDPPERSALGRDRAELLQHRVAQTAHALQSAAADTATLLEQRGDILGEPGLIDYPAVIKRWRVLADQARQVAECWERRR